MEENKNIKLMAAKYYLQNNISVIPVGLDKKPVISWKEYQSRLATKEELEQWFPEGSDNQIGIVTGKISNLAVVDIEEGGDISWLPPTAIAKTGGNGWHFYYSFVEGINNKARIKHLVDIRGEGGYVLAPPSKSSKGEYRWLKKVKPTPFPLSLFNKSEDTREKRRTMNDYEGFPSGQRNAEMASYIGYVLTQIHPSDWDTEAYDIIRMANSKNRPPLTEWELKTTYTSIKSAEKRNNRDRWYKKNETDSQEHELWEQERDDVKLMSEVSKEQTIEGQDRYQTGIDSFDTALAGGMTEGDLSIISAPTGQGKCLAKGTKILMFDGSIKNVEDIKVGEKIMGDDSTPRRILSLARGREEMFDVIPVKGDKYTVNKSHILSLKNIDKRMKQDKIDVSVTDYLDFPKGRKHILKGYRAPTEFTMKKVEIDPYFFGLWLGDGDNKNLTISNPDKEIVSYLKDFAIKENLKIVNVEKRKGFCPRWRLTGYNGDEKMFLNKFKKLKVFGNKHIPFSYKTNSTKSRLEVLAGLIDSDGYLFDNCYEIITKSEVLRDDILFLSRSLGFAAYTKIKKGTIKSSGFVGYYHKIIISGDVIKIPVKIKRKKGSKRKQIKNVLHTGIKVKSIGVGDYYGFEIDGNKRFLLGDFTVTHNTTFCQTLTKNFSMQGLPCLWFSYEVMTSHLWGKFQKMGLEEYAPIYIPLKHVTGNVAWIERKIIEAKELYNVKMIFIDHLGFLLPRATEKNSNQNYSAYLGQICRDLKKIALEQSILIFLPVHMRKTDKPNINDIRDSSAIAQESDQVFTLFREEYGDEEMGDLYTNHTLITLAKNRKTGRSVRGWFEMKDELFCYDPFYQSEAKKRIGKSVRY